MQGNIFLANDERQPFSIQAKDGITQIRSLLQSFSMWTAIFLKIISLVNCRGHAAKEAVCKWQAGTNIIFPPPMISIENNPVPKLQFTYNFNPLPFALSARFGFNFSLGRTPQCKSVIVQEQQLIRILITMEFKVLNRYSSSAPRSTTKAGLASGQKAESYKFVPFWPEIPPSFHRRLLAASSTITDLQQKQPAQGQWTGSVVSDLAKPGRSHLLACIRLFALFFSFLIGKVINLLEGCMENLQNIGSRKYHTGSNDLNGSWTLIILVTFCFQLAEAQGCAINFCQTQFCLGSFCGLCDDYYIWDSGSSICRICLDSHCKTCTAALALNVCSVCNDGYYPSSGNCLACSLPFCQTCQDSGTGTPECTQCVSTYTLSAIQTCQPCSSTLPNCSTCSSTSVCTTCITGYVQYLSNCVTCGFMMPGCTECDDTTTCKKCHTDGYYRPAGQSTCQSCAVNILVPNCAVCEYTGQYCVTCAVDHMMSGTTLQCETCSTVITNCSNCDTNQCTICDAGFMLSGGNCASCITYSPYCATCNITQCTSCIPTYYVDTASCTLCSSTIANCVNCTNSTKCTSCLPNFVVMNYATSSSCLSCTFVMAGCIACINITVCTGCDYANGYYLNYVQLCQPCTVKLKNCAVCQNGFACDRCVSDQFALNSSLKCQLCQNLMTGCATCLNSTICNTCISTEYYYNATDSQCYSCNSTISHCKECVFNMSQVICTTCQPGFRFNFNLQCVCITGKPIDGVCIDVIGCIHSAYGGICTECEPGMLLINGLCECTGGQWMVTELCTNVTGCVAILKATPANKCIFCDLQKLQILGEDNICHCQQYYELVNSACQQICGDGVLKTYKCDDGNLIDGDGCSSSCSIQTGYNCSIVDGKTKCIYNQKFTITLVKIEKIDNMNSGRFIFEFSPAVSALSAMNFSKYLDVSIPNTNFTITGCVYLSGLLYINFDYGSDLQGSQATISLNFDPDLFNVKAYSITFPVVSDGLQFTYLLKLKVYGMLKYVFLGLGLLTLFIFMASLPFHKMLGVQTLQTFQVFFIIGLIIDNYEEPFNTLLNLKYTVGMMTFWKYDTSMALNAKLLYNRLGVLKQFFENQVFISPLTILLVIVFLPYFLKYLFNSNSSGQPNDFLKNLIRMCSKLYKCLLFPITIGFSFGSFLALYSETSTYKQWKNPQGVNEKVVSSQVNFILILTFCTLYSFVFWAEVLIPIKTFIAKEMLNVEKAKAWYVCEYLAYSFLLMSFLLGGYQISSKTALLLLTMVVSCQFIVILLKRPYIEGIHTFGIIFNQASLVILTMSLLVRTLKIGQGAIFKEDDNFMILLIFITLLILVDIIAFVRLLSLFKQKCSKSKQIEPQLLKQQHLQEKMLKTFRDEIEYIEDSTEIGNKYLIDNQIIFARQATWIREQQQRVHFGVESLQFNRARLEKHSLKAKLIQYQ